MKNQEIDFSVDLLQALLWQYNDAEKLQQILQSKEDWYKINQQQFWQNWIRDVFDLRTANDFGCTVWAILLGVPLAVVLEPDFLDKNTFGFGSYHVNFNRGNFARRRQSSINLTLQQKRLVLQLRYFQLISRGNVPQINNMLKWVFSDYGLVYVLDPLDMSDAVYVFGFALPSQLSFVLNYYDILPRPATLGVRYVISVQKHWGFGPYRYNFNRGNFGAN